MPKWHDTRRMGTTNPSAAPTYRVKFYSAADSHRGQGVQVATFTGRAEAEAFASVNKLYARPCKVETVAP